MNGLEMYSNDLYLIAEIGINHNGDINLAKQLIRDAASAGFDAVKFQKRTIDEVYSAEFLASYRDSPFGSTQREQKEGLEFDLTDYREIDSLCRELGIDWSASAWDLNSQRFISQFNVEFNKIASPMLANKALLKMVASEKKRTFISTGMSTIEEIDEVVEVFASRGCPFELMHCVSVYPMPEHLANLRCIETLRKRYDCRVGYSGHESSLLKVCVAAVALGATSIERHITLDRAMYGSDQAASVQTNSLTGFVDAVRRIPRILGNGEKVLSEEELVVRKKLRGL